MQQVAIVTGASSGIGWALSKELARAGYALGLTARREDRLEALAQEIEADGGRAAVAAADAKERDASITAIHVLADALGPVDLLVANAGVGLSRPVTEPNARDYETMLRLNVLGPYYAVEAVLPSMLERGRGHLVAISSLASYVTGRGSGQYSATKAALSMWMEATRLELAGTGVSCTTVNPGFVRTPMTDQNAFPMPLLMDVEKAARLIARAIRKKKKVYDFPWRLALGVKILRRLPDRVNTYFMPDRAAGSR